jgi:hypothetical protein
VSGLLDRFPARVWALLLGLAVVAGLAFLVPPSVVQSVGLSNGQYVVVVAATELAAALGIAAVFIRYRTPVDDTEKSEWRFDP